MFWYKEKLGDFRGSASITYFWGGQPQILKLGFF